MKLEDQVLSIEQVVKLQNLGFDVIKNSSTIVIIKENGTFIVNKEMIEKNIFGVTDKIEDMFYSMTIGDIIEVLPENIDNNFFLMFEKDYVAYNNRYLVLMSKEEKNLITTLFETLKWCIKQKHIDL